MADTDPRSALHAARQDLYTARKNLTRALMDDVVKAAARDDAQRRFEVGTTERTTAENNAAAADSALLGFQNTEGQKRVALTGAIGTWLAGTTAATDLARIPSNVPIVLFPVRVETRFDLTSSPKVLKVRIYPDEIWINMHEPALTPAEIEAAKEYYLNSEAAGHADDAEQWRQLLTKMSSQRAAYVLRVMAPTFGAGSSGSVGFGFGSGTSGGAFAGVRFPDDVDVRADVWTRPAEAVLPDRWVVMATRRGSTTTVLGNPIPEPLPTTADPNVPASRMTAIAGDDYKLDDDIVWTVDFARAEAIGMAVRVNLPAGAEATDGTGGFDRLVVLGVKTSLPPTQTQTSPLDSSLLLEQLFDSHHYTRGLAIVPQGTTTNNVEGQPTSFPPDDPQGAVSFPVERGLVAADRFRSFKSPQKAGNAYRLAKLLGLPGGVLENVANHQGDDDFVAGNMNRVLWAGTLGYFMDQILKPVFNDTHYLNARRYFVANVRGRGPAPAFRIGAVPYGVLPILSLRNWAQRGTSTDETQVEAKIVPTLKTLFTVWKGVTSRVLRLGRTTTDPLGDLVKVLATYASSKEVRVRTASGPAVNFNIAELLLVDPVTFFAALRFVSSGVLQRLGHPEWQPRVQDFVFDPGASLFSGNFVVAPDQLSDTTPLTPDYLNNIRTTAPSALLANNTLASDASKATLLYKMVRHSRLSEFQRVARLAAPGFHLPVTVPEREVELFGTVSVIAPMPLDQLFNQVVPNQGGSTYSDVLFRTSSFDPNNPLADANEWTIASTALEFIPTRELERMFMETLDVCSHRLDAWLTALASRRLLEMRTTQESTFVTPIGSAIGGYAFVEDVRPISHNIQNVPGIGLVDRPATNGGFVHAPSMAHAAAAAVLRSGHLSYKAEDPTKYAIDLSSARARLARTLLDEVRGGQPLGAVLGYRFERGLHDHASTVANIDAYRYELRRLFPLVANKSGAQSTDPVDTVAARNVVDGLKLWSANKQNQVPFATDANLPKPAPSPTAPAFNAIQAELTALDQTVDGLMDLMTAESVFQLVRGNVPRASATLDTLALGVRPPDPEIARSVRSGPGVTHRVPFLLTGDTPGGLPSGWPATPTPLAAAELFLDGWAGQLLGKADVVQARVTSKPATPDDAPQTTTTVSLAQLGLRPLEVVALARDTTEANQGSLLDRRLAFVAVGDDPTKVIVNVDYTRVAPTSRTFPEIMEVARAIGAIVSASRTLALEDFALPAEAADHIDDGETARAAAAADLRGRANAAVTALTPVLSAMNSAATALDQNPDNGPTLAAARTALRGASRFLPGATYPTPTAANGDVLAAAKAAAAELQRRSDAEAALHALDADTLDGQARIDNATARLQTLFGRELKVLPFFHAPAAPELRQALDNRDALLGAPQADLNAPNKFLQGASAVRPGLARWRQLALYANALRTGNPRTDLFQLPFLPGERWTGLPFGTGTPPPPGRISILALSPGPNAPAPEDTWRGLLIDEWVEMIPARTESTAVTFNYDNPGAEAGQAVLVAVPASSGPNWVFDELTAAVNDAFDMAKIRSVDPELLDLGQVLPGIYLTQNSQKTNTVSTDFLGSVYAAIGAVFGGIF